MPDTAAIGMREAAAIEELGGETRRVETAECHLGMRGIGEAHRRDAAVAPGLRQQPGERIEAVLGLAQIFRELPLGAVPAAAILIDDGIAVRDEIGGDLGTGARRCAAGSTLGPAPLPFVL